MDNNKPVTMDNLPSYIMRPSHIPSPDSCEINDGFFCWYFGGGTGFALKVPDQIDEGAKKYISEQFNGMTEFQIIAFCQLHKDHYFKYDVISDRGIGAPVISREVYFEGVRFVASKYVFSDRIKVISK